MKMISLINPTVYVLVMDVKWLKTSHMLANTKEKKKKTIIALRFSLTI